MAATVKTRGKGGSDRKESAPVPPPRLDWIPHVMPPDRERPIQATPLVLSGALMHKKLIVRPGICVGCKLCELACSLTHGGVMNPYLARLRVNQVREEGLAEPVVCRHCNPAPCEQACPTKALFRSAAAAGVVILDGDKCIQCHACIDACPFGAAQIGPQGEVLKCDLCGGNPACAAVCQDRPEFRPPHWCGGKTSALAFVEPQDANRVKRLQRLRKPRKG